MADYHSPTIVQPNIPAADMTPLERFVLDRVFDAESEDVGIYCHFWCGPSGIVTLSVEELRAASDESRGSGPSSIGDRIGALLARFDAEDSADPSDDVDLDLNDSDSGWDRIFQDIVGGSSTIDEIVVTTAFTCTKMRPDGFGGSVMLITADAIRYRSTTDMLEELWNEVDKEDASRRIRSRIGAS